jgi:hypothetical protein
MIYVLAALLPPIGLLLNGQPFSAIFNLVLIVFCAIFGLIFHVLLLVPSAHALIAVHMKRDPPAWAAAGLSTLRPGTRRLPAAKCLCMAGKRFDSAFRHAIDHRQPYRWASIRR